MKPYFISTKNFPEASVKPDPPSLASAKGNLHRCTVGQLGMCDIHHLLLMEQILQQSRLVSQVLSQISSISAIRLFLKTTRKNMTLPLQVGIPVYPTEKWNISWTLMVGRWTFPLTWSLFRDQLILAEVIFGLLCELATWFSGVLIWCPPEKNTSF